MTTLTLTDFLLARIAEDEAVARAATQGRWEWKPPQARDWAENDEPLVSFQADCKWESDGYFGGCSDWLMNVAGVGEPDKFGRHTHPTSVDVLSGWGYDASGIAARDEDRTHVARHHPARVLAECEAKRRIVERLAPITEVDAGCVCDRCETLRDLAHAYADHSDYRQEWRS